MRIRRDENPVERIGVTGETKFQMESNAQAFEILSSGIYTDPILAVVRELSCNAYDSHVMADKADVPFTVHLPSKLEPYFSVKDDGIGLCNEDVLNLYATYFKSTKNEDDSQIGAFGLGSKSPFSYSKAFDVIARWDGTKRTYSVFINEEGVPTIAELAKVDTDECNGIEIKIAVRQNDFDQFRYKVADALQYFPTRPEVKGYQGFEWPEIPESTTITQSYHVRKGGSGGLTAVQGNVAYKVSLSQLQSVSTGVLSNAAERFANNHTIVLFFEIGELDISASREEVRYEERTCKNIANAIDAAFEDYLNVLNEEMNELTKKGSKWEVYALLADKFGSAYSLRNTIGQYKFDSKLVNEWIDSDGQIEYTVDFKYHTIVPYRHGHERAVRAQHNYSGYGDNKKYVVHPGNRIRIIKHDVTKRGSMRMNQLLNDYRWNSNSILAIVPITDRQLAKSNVTVTKRQRTMEFNKIVKMLGGPNVDALSEVTEDVLPEHKKERKAGLTFKRFHWSGWVRNRRTKPVFNECKEPDDGGLYIQIDQLRNFIVNDDKLDIKHHTFCDVIPAVLRVINYVHDTEYKTGDIYGLTKKVVKSVEDSDDWVNLLDIYKEALEEIKDIHEFYVRINKSNSLGGIGYAIRNNPSFCDMVTGLDADSYFREQVEPVVEVSQAAKELEAEDDELGREAFENLRSFNNHFGIKVADVENTSYFESGVFEDYTLLRHIDLDYPTNMEDAKKLIEMIEAQ